ncbi:hypothetical protein AAFF_G00434050 [Aldrovandia affinis]|uniref:Uncharacterized protein n=1 Tax=Aldrovandia affinis TaxID=143900 RepID=A0AAD7SAD7_9TELE|nr:hypothetical protein AAFF_G00434050 [Aldrovandia affinis]
MVTWAAMLESELGVTAPERLVLEYGVVIMDIDLSGHLDCSLEQRGGRGFGWLCTIGSAHIPPVRSEARPPEVAYLQGNPLPPSAAATPTRCLIPLNRFDAESDSRAMGDPRTPTGSEACP